MKSEEDEESAARMNFNSSKRLNEASITVETSLSLLRLKCQRIIKLTKCTLKTEHRMKKKQVMRRQQ